MAEDFSTATLETQSGKKMPPTFCITFIFNLEINIQSNYQ